jgi:pimeloyl-ACP methyl ester carboxylesterase
MMSAARLLCLCLALALTASGCAFLKLKEEVAGMESTAGLGGIIHSQAPLQGKILVFLTVEKNGRKQIQQMTFLEQEGVYLFLVTAGVYHISAFMDVNGDLQYDEGEPAAFTRSPIDMQLPQRGPNDEANLVLSSDVELPHGFPRSMRFSVNDVGTNILKAGIVADLNDNLFSLENAHMGFWQPLTFTKRFGAGIYFTEPYDKNKIPILFVHGAAGTPRNFQYLAEFIDREKYQPWFYYYPSGVQLDRLGNALNYLVSYLHDRYRFDRLYITAHSMGGLVARSFILKNHFRDKQRYIRLFVSISTPWGGLETAARGVESAPAAIPSWHDVVPNSPFIQGLFNRQLKPDIPYYLFFSYKGECSLFMDNNDGAITLPRSAGPPVPGRCRAGERIRRGPCRYSLQPGGVEKIQGSPRPGRSEGKGDSETFRAEVVNGRHLGNSTTGGSLITA